MHPGRGGRLYIHHGHVVIAAGAFDLRRANINSGRHAHCASPAIVGFELAPHPARSVNKYRFSESELRRRHPVGRHVRYLH